MGLKAGLYGQTTLEQRHFQYAVHPGAALSDSFDVINFTDQQRTFTLYGADLVQGKQGVAPSFPSERQRDAGAWIHVDRGSVTLGPKAQARVGFTVNVPEDAAPGDHLGAVVASYKPKFTPGVVIIESRVALMVRVRIPGVAKLDGVVGPLHVGPGRGGRRFSVEVHNTGNLLLTTLGKIEIKHGHDTVAEVPVKPKQIYIIPGGIARFTATWKGTPLFGNRKATAVFILSAFKENDITRRSNTITLSFFSWPLIILLLLLIAAAIVAAWIRRRRRRGGEPPSDPGPAELPSSPRPVERVTADTSTDDEPDDREWYS